MTPPPPPAAPDPMAHPWEFLDKTAAEWSAGHIQTKAATMDLADGYIALRSRLSAAEREAERLRRENEELKENALLDGECWQMVRAVLERLDGASPGTPPMMFPEWIACVVAKAKSGVLAGHVGRHRCGSGIPSSQGGRE